MFKTTVLYEKNLACTARTVVNQGGTSSGKTYAIMQVLFTKALQDPGSVTTVVGQDVPNLKKGAMRDAKSIVADSPILQGFIASYNSTDRIYELTNGSIIEFTSYGDAQDAKSGKRKRLFINEANGIAKDIYTELDLRTYEQVFIDYNPNSVFWVHTDVIPKPDTSLLISDHRHNPFLPEVVRANIESLRDKDAELWKVYGRGLTGKIEGLIFPNTFSCPAVPDGARLLGYGLDFGYTNDPTALVAVYLHLGELWLDELIYDYGLTNPDIAARLKELGVTRTAEIIADSADPKSITEVHRFGFNVHPAAKGPDSVKNGIDILKRYKLNITSRSKNFWKEALAYKWKKDKQGTTLNEPVDTMNHAWDATRYLALRHLSVANRVSMGVRSFGGT